LLPIPDSLDGWLAHIERLHVKPIALGLERVRGVKRTLGFRQTVPVIVVGGTNGKGSVCAMLERILLAGGYRVGLYTSPHLLRYNERVRIDGEPASDAALCEAFAKVEQARGNTRLTYFEFGTLAAWQVFASRTLDVVILEVGLGGRLDAVNIFDADCDIVTSVDIDHTEFLGETREQIGYEKAGIFRAGVPAIVGEARPPQSLIEHGRTIGAKLAVFGRDFGVEAPDRVQWLFHADRGPGGRVRRGGLAYPALRGANQLTNAAVALAAIEALAEVLPVSMNAIRRGLAEVELPGRFQVIPGRPAVVLDVAHNPHAAQALAGNLDDMGFFPRTLAVFGMLRDKDVAGVVGRLRGRVDHWLLAGLGGARGASADELRQIIERAGHEVDASSFDTPALAYAAARERASESDRILIFGSFLTVAGVMHAMAK
jgi:dihydrofolate synthase/folylpolyglutamate synthase